MLPQQRSPQANSDPADYSKRIAGIVFLSICVVVMGLAFLRCLYYVCLENIHRLRMRPANRKRRAGDGKQMPFFHA